ncbi:hypothetical protein H8959_009378 [Pygathrix nigripes]
MTAISRYMELTIEPVQQWDPEDVNLEGSKDKVELLGSRVHRDSGRTAHLSDDD